MNVKWTQLRENSDLSTVLKINLDKKISKVLFISKNIFKIHLIKPVISVLKSSFDFKNHCNHNWIMFSSFNWLSLF